MADNTDATEIGSAFRSAMRRVASTVTIVTANDHQRHHGMTATSVTSLSMDPPSLIVCLHQKTLLHAIMLEARRFCVNVLHKDQEALSAAFSGAVPAETRFGHGTWERTTGGLAYLTDAQANMFCRKIAAIPLGTHTIFVGEVDDVKIREAVAPLVYQDAVYCVASPAGRDAA